ncbi:MAG: glycerol-3-phosphate dehydrogenase/oxidase [Bdellovibrio sp.]|nr:MAG: glycerol-3-phosphate dehydrogenase/oxidase [Bdellovibrio sp.]
MKSFAAADRTSNIQRLRNEHFDLVIIGGGINGAGAARDACLRGMKVGLVEANDFAFGSSSRSSKLIHGGIRYLENRDFHLVFEALAERRTLLEIAPHLVHPLKFMIPMYEGGRVSPRLMSLGMWLYDALALFETPEAHERLRPTEALQEIPFLLRQGLQAAFTYADAYMDDDRLVIETLRSANEAGLVAANYVKAVGRELDPQGRMVALEAEDLRASSRFQIRADRFITTVGPWVDTLASRLFTDWKRHLRPTKGIHLTFSRTRFPLKMAVVMAAEERIVFAIPRHEMVLVGTTDTDFNGNLDQLHAEAGEVDYLLKVVDRYFPGLKITPQDIVASYAGVRPLVDDGAVKEGKTSREHTIETDGHGVTYVMGGKYTTYRRIAEQAVKKVLETLPLEKRAQWRLCQTEQPLNALITAGYLDRAEEEAGELVALSGLGREDAARLYERHGDEALEMARSFPDLRSLVEFEAAHAILMTMCLNLSDFYFRRLPLYLSRPDHGLSEITRIADVFAAYHNWSNAERNDQIHSLQEKIQAELNWRR